MKYLTQTAVSFRQLIVCMVIMALFFAGATAISPLAEARRFHATQLYGIDPYDTVAAPSYKGEVRFRRQPGDSALYFYNGRTAGNRWTRFTGFDTISNLGLRDSILVQIAPHTLGVKSIRDTASDGTITITPTIDANSILYDHAVSGKSRVAVSSAASLTLSTSIDYVFTGTTSTWTLPTIASSGSRIYFIKNRGSGTVTLNSAGGGNDIYYTSAVSTLAITAGQAYRLVNDGTVFVVYKCD